MLYSEISNYENGRCECARAHIEVKTGGTAGQARVYREIWRHKSGTHPLQTVPHPLQTQKNGVVEYWSNGVLGQKLALLRSLNRKTGASGNVSLLYSEISKYEK